MEKLNTVNTIDFNSDLLPSNQRPCTYTAFVWYDMIDRDSECEYREGETGRQGLTSDDFDIHYDKFKQAIADMVAKYYEEELSQHTEQAGITMKAKEKTTMLSPREYNFSTDSIDFIVTINHNKCLEYIEDNQYEMHQYVQEHFTSRDGFMSYTPNTVQGIRQSIIDEDDSYSQAIGAIIAYIIHDEELDCVGYYDFQSTYYEAVQDNLYLVDNK